MDFRRQLPQLPGWSSSGEAPFFGECLRVSSRGVTVAGDFMAIHTRQRGATEKVKSEGVV